jgi:predicted nucleotidyltransferase
VSILNDPTDLPQRCAALLYARGAKRVWLFGALASDHLPDNRSDLDLVVEGIPAQKLASLSRELRQMIGRKVDLVDMASAPPRLRPHILRTRVLLPMRSKQ